MLVGVVVGGLAILGYATAKKVAPYWALAVALPLLLAVAVVGDLWFRNSEMTDLVAATEASENVMEEGWIDARREVWNEYEEEADRLARREREATGIDNAHLREGVRQAQADLARQLFDDLRALADDAQTDLIVARERIQRLDFAPWHSAAQQARDTMLSHVDAWILYMDDWRTLPDGAERWPPGSPEIDATFDIAEADYRDAISWWPGSDLEERVDGIFAE